MIDESCGLYGLPPRGVLVEPAHFERQFSPTMPDAEVLEDVADAVLSGFTVLAPPGTIERRAVIAHALRATRAGGSVTVLAPKDRGGARLRAELEAFGCAVDETARRHHRICVAVRPDNPSGLEGAIAAGGPQRVEALGLWSQPGIFSWDRIDPGSVLLAEHATDLQGRGADFGCGNGWLAKRVLGQAAVKSLVLVDIDRRAVECARRNVVDTRATFVRSDVRARDAAEQAGLRDLDFVVMNPPFHAGGQEDKALGQAFVGAAATALRRGGICWLVANRHLPYEKVLGELFTEVRPGVRQGGFKLFRARK